MADPNQAAAEARRFVGYKLYDTFIENGAVINLSKEEFANTITSTVENNKMVYEIATALTHIDNSDFISSESFPKKYIEQLLHNKDPGADVETIIDNGVLLVRDKSRLPNLLEEIAKRAEKNETTKWHESSPSDYGASIARGLLSGRLLQTIQDSEQALDKTFMLQWRAGHESFSLEETLEYVNEATEYSALAMDFRHTPIARHACHKIGLAFLRNLWKSAFFKSLTNTQTHELMNVITATFGILSHLEPVNIKNPGSITALPDRVSGLLVPGFWRDGPEEPEESALEVPAGLKIVMPEWSITQPINKKALAGPGVPPPGAKKARPASKVQKKIGISLETAPTQDILAVEKSITALFEDLDTRAEAGYLGRLVHLGIFRSRKEAEARTQVFTQAQNQRHYITMIMAPGQTMELCPLNECASKHLGPDLSLVSPIYQKIIARFMAATLALDYKYADLRRHLEMNQILTLLMKDLNEFLEIGRAFMKHRELIAQECPRAIKRIDHFLSLLGKEGRPFLTTYKELLLLLSQDDPFAGVLTEIAKILLWPAPIFSDRAAVFQYAKNLASDRHAAMLIPRIQSPWFEELKERTFIDHRAAYDIMYEGLMALRLAAAGDAFQHVVMHSAIEGAVHEEPFKDLMDFWTGAGKNEDLARRLIANVQEYQAIKEEFKEKTGRGFYNCAREDYKTACWTMLQAATAHNCVDPVQGKVIFEILATKFYNPVVSHDALLTKIDAKFFVPLFSRLYPTLALTARHLQPNPLITTTLDNLILGVAAHCLKHHLENPAVQELAQDKKEALVMFMAYVMASYMLHGVSDLTTIIKAAPDIQPLSADTTVEVDGIRTLHRTMSQLVISYGLCSSRARGSLLSQFSQTIGNMVIGISAAVGKQPEAIEQWTTEILGFCQTNIKDTISKLTITPSIMAGE